MKVDITLRQSDKKEYKYVKKTVKKLMKKNLKPRLKHFNDNLIRLHTTIDHIKNEYNVLYHLHLPPKKILVAKESSDNLHHALEEAMKDLERQVEKHVAKISGRENWKRKQRRNRIKQYKVDLPTLVDGNTKEAVTKVIEPLLPKLDRYIKHELTYLQANGDLPSNYPTVEDIRDEAMLKVQFKWDELEKENEKLYQELIKAINKVLTEEVIQSQLDADNISLDSDVPKDAMQQAEEMVGEEVGEFYQPFERLHIEDIIPDQASDIPEELIEQNAPELSYQTMANLPNDWRRMLILAHRENMPVETIAKTIMPMALSDAQKILDFAEQFMLASLSDRGLKAIDISMLQKLLK